MAKKKTTKRATTKSTKKTAAAKPSKQAQPRDFQSIIATLQQYWMDQGCVLWQPYNEKVGAGTMNPATFLRVLGPEPWNVAYVEPSVRPDDGRYGENPNRLQQHTQFQVILKPDPGNPQELYLRSLQAIGIDVHKHDIRFVEDNWASPALGAWGLGWEVWLDGLEITQFTYFQQSGGITLDPVSVEITYGMDRIAMALQGVQNVGDIQWDRNRNWGDMLMQGEREHSKYFFELADVDRLRQMVELYEAEAKAALEAGLMLPAYDYVLKTSHTFNVLDARGAIGVTERQGYFRRMRALSSQVAQAFASERERQQHPWGKVQQSTKFDTPGKVTGPKKSADFLLEIGTEELPPDEIKKAVSYFEIIFKAQVFDTRFTYKKESYKVFATPRRLVISVEALEPTVVHHFKASETKGPPAHIAFDSLGKPTQALTGWANRNQIPLDEISTREIDGGTYAVHLREPAVFQTAQVLADILPTWILGIKFDKTMRWNDNGVNFSRPIRWILALYGSHVIPFDLVSSENLSKNRLLSSNTSSGLRLSSWEKFKVNSPKNYFKTLEALGIVLENRSQIIRREIDAKALNSGGFVPEDPALLEEVANLVEAPTALLGEFEAKYLELPREVLIAVMKKHQRYFPVQSGDKLLNKFIFVGNGDFDAKLVTAGNADVIRARFADAAYFIKRDRETKLSDFVDKLKQLTFQKDLGSMWDKTQRIVALTKELSATLGLSPDDARTAERAAQLSKADLATKMVVEMTSLQGVMGKYYALDAGEPAPVADAIFEHYLPRYAGDAVPQSAAAFAVGLADRLDTLAGLFAMNLEPTGAKDPFAQRRAAIGLVQALIARTQDLDLREAVRLAAAAQPVVVSDEARNKVVDFITQRLRAVLLESGARHDVVEAVLAVHGHNPVAAAKGVENLEEYIGSPGWAEMLAAFSRCVRITRDLDEIYSVDENSLTGPDRELLTVIRQAEVNKGSSKSIDFFFNLFVPMVTAITQYFSDVLIMVEDKPLRSNRLGLLQRIVALADGVVDFSKLEGF